MSGIFGFTYKTELPELREQALAGLAHWNRIYGAEAFDDLLVEDSGIGCHIEHFSDRFPFGAPLQKTGDMIAVIDALLFNRDELLLGLGLDELSEISDEELLLLLVQEKGYDALAGVNGDFAGAVYDRSSGEWILFRDHLGVRPLYIYRDSQIFAFSTDIRGLASIPGTDLGLNELHFYKNVLGFNSLSLQDTDYQNIRCAMPGAITRVKSTGNGFALDEAPYWRIGQKKIRFERDEMYIRRMNELITDAVNRRLDAIPGLIGAELSGGLDSSVIDILINRHGRNGCYFSWSNSPEVLPIRQAGDERQVILDICQQEGISCHFLSREDQIDYQDMLNSGVPPFVDTPQLSYGSAWMNRQGARVVFTGHGGDEGVSHRGRRYELFYNHEYLAYFRLYWEDLRGKPFRYLRGLRAGLVNAHANYKSIMEQAPESAYDVPILQKQFRERMRERFQDQQMYFYLKPCKYVMQGGTRPRLDNAAYQGANAGMRYLFPYVDYRVMDYAVSIPRRLHVSRNSNRTIFREAFREIMPKSLYDVNYKDLASIRDLPRKGNYEGQMSGRIQYLAESLDPEFWDGILDLEVIAHLKPQGEHRSKEEGSFKLLLHTLSKALFIQNMVKVAREWRQQEDEDKLV